MKEQTYGWNLEMQMRAARAGLRILEVPVDHRCRTGGESKVSGTLRGTFVAGTRILATLLRVAAERPNEKQNHCGIKRLRGLLMQFAMHANDPTWQRVSAPDSRRSARRARDDDW